MLKLLSSIYRARIDSHSVQNVHSALCIQAWQHDKFCTQIHPWPTTTNQPKGYCQCSHFWFSLHSWMLQLNEADAVRGDESMKNMKYEEVDETSSKCSKQPWLADFVPLLQDWLISRMGICYRSFSHIIISFLSTSCTMCLYAFSLSLSLSLSLTLSLSLSVRLSVCLSVCLSLFVSLFPSSSHWMTAYFQFAFQSTMTMTKKHKA